MTKGLLLALSLLPSLALACGNNWGIRDTVLELADISIAVIDYEQTRNWVSQGGPEANTFFLGKYPSDPRLINSLALRLIFHAGVSLCLGQKHRTKWQFVSSFLAAAIVNRNFTIGMDI